MKLYFHVIMDVFTKWLDLARDGVHDLATNFDIN